MSARFKIVESEHAAIEAMSDVSLEIMAERDKTEREIAQLAEAGKRDEAWAFEEVKE